MFVGFDGWMDGLSWIEMGVHEGKHDGGVVS